MRADSGLGGDFWRFFAGQTISNLGSSVTLFALPLLVYNLTGSALNLGSQPPRPFCPTCSSGSSSAPGSTGSTASG